LSSDESSSDDDVEDEDKDLLCLIWAQDDDEDLEMTNAVIFGTKGATGSLSLFWEGDRMSIVPMAPELDFFPLELQDVSRFSSVDCVVGFDDCNIDSSSLCDFSVDNGGSGCGELPSFVCKTVLEGDLLLNERFELQGERVRAVSKVTVGADCCT
jgi:hypothetical protein